MKFIFYILLILNIIAFFTVFSDKRKSIKRAWRIPEKTLFLLAIFGGSIGIFTGMHIWRHKTQKIKFTVGIPLIIIIQIIFVYYLFCFLN